MERDALICRKGRFGWRWCVIPLDLLDAFIDHGWVKVLSADDMQETAIADVRASEIRKWEPLNQMRFKPPACNGD